MHFSTIFDQFRGRKIFVSRVHASRVLNVNLVMVDERFLSGTINLTFKQVDIKLILYIFYITTGCNHGELGLKVTVRF